MAYNVRVTALQDKVRTAKRVRVAIGDRFFIYDRIEGDSWRETVLVHQGNSQTAANRNEGSAVVTTVDVLTRVGDNAWPAVHTWAD